MAQVELQANLGSKRKIHALPKIDMTPMVDLGFLLITFFIFTTSLAEPRAASLIMPKNGKPTPVKEGKVLNAVLLSENKVLVYEGDGKQVQASHIWQVTGFDEKQGLGHLIRLKQERLASIAGEKGKDDMILLIKPLATSSYKNLVDALDEAMINDVKRFMVTDPAPEEERMAAAYKMSY